MRKRIVATLLLIIIFVASLLRFWQLGATPPSPDWDEAALGYNAYSILQTGKDEYGQFLPVVLRSFGDYKPALYAYLAIPSVAVFDLSTLAVRLPSAIFGLLAVLGTYLLIKELFTQRGNTQNETLNHADTLALFTSFLLAISPWHIQFSRVAFEANIGMAFNIFTALFFLNMDKS